MAQQVTIKMEVDGKALSHYSSVKIWQNLFEHHEFEIIVPFESLEKEDEHFFKDSHGICGKSISITFDPVFQDVFGSSKNKFDFVFKGVITSIGLRNRGDMDSCFVIGGYSPTILLEDVAIKKTYHKLTVKDIVSKVLSNYPGNTLRSEISSNSKTQYPYTVQYNETNFQFISRLADENGEWFYYNGEKIISGQAKGKEVKFDIDGVQSFDMSIELKPGKFELTGYDYASDKEFSATYPNSVQGLGDYSKFALKESDNLFTHAALLVPQKPVESNADLTELAKIKRSMMASKLVMFKGTGEVPNLTIGTVISVTGTAPAQGGRDDSTRDFGKYRIIEVDHSVDESGNYSNTFTAIPESVQYPPPNPHVKYPVAQTELANVIDNKDPDKLGRIKVAFLWPGDSKESAWMRVGSFYSGGSDGQGMFFTPEVGAQVMVGYALDRAENPFVITSVYPKKSMVRGATPKNEEKFIYTMAGNQIVLNDKQGQNSIEITNVNKTDTAITIEFQGNGVISLKTSGKVNIEAQESVTIKAKQKLSMEAMDIEIKATNSLKCEATTNLEIKSTQLKFNADATALLKAGASVKVEGALAELAASGIATISGAMVKIN